MSRRQPTIGCWPSVRGWVLVLVLTMPPVGAQAGGPLLTAPAGEGAQLQPPWQVVGLPQQATPLTRYSAVTLDDERVLRVEAQASYGNLVHPLPRSTAAQRLRWRWRLDQPNPAADLRRKDGDDSPVKLCVLFDLPISAVPFIERQLLRFARLRTGQTLPAASVCYLWDARLGPGTVLDNAHTRRVRMVVLRGPEAPLQVWHSEERDVRADFLRLFGDETGVLPPLLGVAIAGDADNTRGHSVAHVQGLTLD